MAQEMNVQQEFDHAPMLSNQQTINHQPDKFTFDFMSIFPQFDHSNNPTAVISHKTVVLDPHVAKDFLAILKDNIAKYEEKFGKIKMPDSIKKTQKEVAKKQKMQQTSTPSYLG
jgi:hypothetical protein